MRGKRKEEVATRLLNSVISGSPVRARESTTGGSGRTTCRDMGEESVLVDVVEVAQLNKKGI